MTLSPAGLALKLPAQQRDQLLAEDATPLRYFAKAPIKKEYVVLPETMARDDIAMVLLMESSVCFVLAKPHR